jgi:uncharacterized Tic20 family protein
MSDNIKNIKIIQGILKDENKLKDDTSKEEDNSQLPIKFTFWWVLVMVLIVLTLFSVLIYSNNL